MLVRDTSHRQLENCTLLNFIYTDEFSCPILLHCRLQDSDENISGQLSAHFLPPIYSVDSLDSCSANSLSSSGRHNLELEHKVIVTPESEDSRSDDVFEDATSTETEAEEHLGNATAPLAQLTSGRTSLNQLESDDEGANKGDSGIDPGELFVGSVVSHDEVTVRNQDNLSTCSESDKTPNNEEFEREERNGVEEKETFECVHVADEGTPPCLSPIFIASKLPDCVRSHTEIGTSVEKRQATSMFRSPSTDTVPPTTPCVSPQAPSSTSDITLFLPNPSTPWAPPSSPIRSNYYRLSSSLPSSPAQKNRPFRFSLEVQEALFPPFDPSAFTSPLILGTNSLNLRSTPKSSIRQAQSKYKRRSLRHSCGHNTSLPTFPEDSEYENGLCSKAWREDSSLCVNLDQQFSRLSQFARPSSPLQRTRSASNPAPVPAPVQPAHYSLTLARRHSPGNPHSTSSASFYKYYTIKPCRNCRLSSSEPNLTACFSKSMQFL